MCGVSVMAFAPCGKVAFKEGDEVFGGEAVGLIGEALHAVTLGALCIATTGQRKKLKIDRFFGAHVEQRGDSRVEAKLRPHP